MYCKQCGAYLPEDASVCPACGRLVTAEPPAAPQPPLAGTAPDGAADETPAPETPAPETPAPQAPAAQTPPEAPAPGAVPPPPPGPAYARQGPAYGPGAPNGPAPGAAPPPPPGWQPAPQSPTVGLGEWLWSSIVAAIPLVGFIVLLVWSFGGGAKPSKRNWARASLILSVAATVIGLVLLLVLAVSAATFASGVYFDPYYYYY